MERLRCWLLVLAQPSTHLLKGQVSGLLLQASQLRRFWWDPLLATFRIEPLLQPHWWPQRRAKVCCGSEQ